MIEKMTESTIKGAVDLHIEVFKDSFLTSLDRDVLTGMYENYVSSELGRAYVYIENGEIIGLVAGAINPSVYYNQLLKKRGIRFFWLTLKRVIKEPKILLSMARRDYSGFFRPDESQEAYGKASLDVIGVKEEYRGTGIAQRLAEVFLNELRESGVSEVNLGVSPTNFAAKRFYEKIGLKYLRTDRHPDGKEVHIYGMKFDT
jgi:ribosomal protein S18 acetylase RimI-like enzyme